MLINDLFDLLDDWRKLPAYQLERRADIFFALYLKAILKEKSGLEIETIIPEFPVRKGEISTENKEINQSFKIDYLALAKDNASAFLIELKTDQGSRNPKQDKYLKDAAAIKIKGLIDGLLKIVGKTREKKKYGHLLKKVEKAKLINIENGQSINSCGDIKTEIIYIQPHNPDGHANTISFGEIINVLEHEQDELTRRFVASLRKWGR